MRWKLFIWFYCLPFISLAQNKQFDAQESFLKDAETLMKTVDNRKVADSVFNDFKTVWSGQLNKEQQELCWQISKSMKAKGYPPNPHYVEFYACVAFGVKNDMIVGEKLTQFLLIADTTCRIYKAPVFPNFIRNSRIFLETKKLYDSKYNSCTPTGGTFTFGHTRDFAMLDPEYEVVEEIPLIEEDITFESEPDTLSWDEPDEESSDDDGWDDWEIEESTDDGWEVDTLDGSVWEEGVGAKDLEEEIKPMAEWMKARWEKEKELGSAAKLFIASVMPKPTVKGPFIDIQNTDLVFSSIYDTMVITNTSGQLMLKNLEFVGDSGRVTWEELRLDPNNVYADLSAYNINLKKPELFAEAAHMTYLPSIDISIPGICIYKIDPANGRPNAKYPTFVSYFNDIKLSDLGEGIVYEGGFTLRGRKILSKSLSGGKSSLTVSETDSVRFKLASYDNFIFKDSTISINQSDVTLYYNNGRDSLTNRGMSIKYHKGKKSLRARRDKGAYKKSPFKTTYHQVEFLVEYLSWDLEKDSIDFKMLNARNKIPMEIESYNYFDLEVLARQTGFYGFNPIQSAVYFATKIKKSKTFESYELAKHYKLNPRSVRTAMTELDAIGFVKFDPVVDEVTLERKAMLYAFANQRLTDYDDIRILSTSPGKPNASLKLESNDLVIQGVSSFTISDSMKVQVAPRGKEIILKKNRNTEFSGKMRSGSFVYKGSNFEFNYDTFVVNMPRIDEVSILLADTASGEDTELPNGLVGTSGKLFISQPGNKSALREHTGYPKFTTDQSASIYFGGDEVLGGAYKADTNIVFDIPPFSIDSLNSSNPSAINFNGTFRSGGIFPDFDEKVSIMPDKSLGFKTSTPPEGYKIYAGKLRETAIFYDSITLNNNGIRGNGKMEYLTGTFFGEDYIFFSDSVRTGKPGSSATIAPGNYKDISYPSVKMEKYNLRWFVNQDSMILSSTDKDFEIYNPDVAFEGTMVLSPDGLYGNGDFETKRARAFSRNFTFRENYYEADNTTFLIKSDNPKKPAMLGEDISVRYDFKEKYADIKSQTSAEQTLRFPYTQYATNLENAHWDFEAQTIKLSVSDASQLNSSKFISTNPLQDGLEFNATKATYDLKENTINAEGVPFIRVANVLIKPKDGKLTIRENANMDRLEDCVIIMNAFTKYHTLTQGNIKITSRKSFDGNALYDYKNEAGQNANILFQHFKIKTEKKRVGKETVEAFVTTGQAKVKAEEKFPIFPGILYQGEVNLVDYKEHLEFKGLIAPNLPRDLQWFEYVSNDTATQGKVPVDENTKVAGSNNKLLTGLFISKANRGLYGSFLEYEENRANDFAIFQAKGLLSYDNTNDTYLISPLTKTRGEERKGQQFIYHDKNQEIKAEGLFNLIGKGKGIIVNCGAHSTIKMKTGEYTLDATIAVNFAPNPQAFEAMAIDMRQSLSDKSPIHYFRQNLYDHLAELLPQEQLDKYIQSSQEGDMTLSKFLPEGITLSQVQLKWSEEHQSFYTEGKISIANIFKNDADVEVDGFIEIPKSENNSDIGIYLEIPDGNWYYIGYFDGKLITYSSSDSFNNLMLAKKDTEKITLGTEEDAQLFKVNFLRKYRDLKEIELLPSDEVIEDDPFKKKKKKKKKKEEEEEKKDGF